MNPHSRHMTDAADALERVADAVESAGGQTCALRKTAELLRAVADLHPSPVVGVRRTIAAADDLARTVTAAANGRGVAS